MRDLACADDVVSRGRPSVLQRLAAGDLSALEDVYDRHAAPLYRLALSILGSEADAEDVVQDVLLGLMRRRGARIRDLRLYLLASARHRAISLLRRRRREVLDGQSQSTLFEASVHDPVEAVRAREIGELLLGLPPEQREVIVLKVYDEMTFAEIARVVKARPNTVASRYRYAVEKLRRFLGGCRDDK